MATGHHRDNSCGVLLGCGMHPALGWVAKFLLAQPGKAAAPSVRSGARLRCARCLRHCSQGRAGAGWSWLLPLPASAEPRPPCSAADSQPHQAPALPPGSLSPRQRGQAAPAQPCVPPQPLGQPVSGGRAAPGAAGPPCRAAAEAGEPLGFPVMAVAHVSGRAGAMGASWQASGVFRKRPGAACVSTPLRVSQGKVEGRAGSDWLA